MTLFFGHFSSASPYNEGSTHFLPYFCDSLCSSIACSLARRPFIASRSCKLSSLRRRVSWSVRRMDSQLFLPIEIKLASSTQRVCGQLICNFLTESLALERTLYEVRTERTEAAADDVLGRCRRSRGKESLLAFSPAAWLPTGAAAADDMVPTRSCPPC